MSTRLHSHKQAQRGGFTLLEVTIVTTLLLFGLLALTSSSHALNLLREAESEQSQAQNALETATRSIVAACNAQRKSGDPWPVAVVSSFGAGGAIRPTFSIDGLQPWNEDEDVGFVELVSDETLTDDELGVVLGMPQDLDGDGVINSNDVTGTASLLPLVVRVRWTGAGGQRELVQGLYVAEF